jgi:hypothetical protein
LPLGGVAAAKRLVQASGFVLVTQPASTEERVAKFAIVGVSLLLSAS